MPNGIKNQLNGLTKSMTMTPDQQRIKMEII